MYNFPYFSLVEVSGDKQVKRHKEEKQGTNNENAIVWKEDIRQLQKVFVSFLAKRTLADPVSKIRVKERTVDINKITKKVFLRKTKVYGKEQQQKLLESLRKFRER
jgi:hypothetical protein